MIVKESPTRKRLINDTSWPPKSPREVLLNSPSRQRRLRQAQDQNAHSLSPTRRSLLNVDTEALPSEDEIEDEETLQLKLEAIEARLKLKKLRKAKLKAHSNDELLQAEETKAVSTKSANDPEQYRPKVQVPLSPRRNPPAQPKLPESPRRVQLGIDKGLRANDVSLKRVRREPERQRRDLSKQETPVAKVKTFNERLVAARLKENQRFEKQERAETNRSRGFGIAESKLAQTNRDEEEPVEAEQCTTLPSVSRQKAMASHRSALRGKAPGGGYEDSDLEKYSGFTLSQRFLNEDTLDGAFENKELMHIPKLLSQVIAPNYDPPDIDGDYVVFGIIASKTEPYQKAKPHLTTSTADEDDEQKSFTNKFMVLRVIDLNWELDLFLFDTAFARFWKLTVGTVIAILNPGIMPPKIRDIGKFSLKLASSEDTILEIGAAKDIGWCKSIKKDGKECMQWVDGRKTEFCDFHVNLRIDKAKAGRMEINSMLGVGLFSNQNRYTNCRSGTLRRSYGAFNTWNGASRRGSKYDNVPVGTTVSIRAQGETTYILPKSFSTQKNTTKILDAEDYVHGGLSKAERSRKRLAAKAKERELARRLGADGSGLGGEYMRENQRRAKTATEESDTYSRRSESAAGVNDDYGSSKRDAFSLGLVRSRGDQEIDLGPVQGGRFKGDARTSADAMGWSGAFKRGLLSPTRGRSPEKKKVRLKVPSDNGQTGLESKLSLGKHTFTSKVLDTQRNDTNDDDDDLDIV